jgi:NDP-sugar pyrophosphorylase family protein
MPRISRDVQRIIAVSGEKGVIGFILAAGFGTRLLPLTNHIPKALVPVCGVPVLKRAYDFFTANGIRRVAINSHHCPDQVDLFVKNNLPEVRIFHEQGTIRGTGGGLAFAKQFLGSDDAFCVANVDIVTNADLAGLAGEFLRSSNIAGLVAAPSENGTIRFDPGTGEFLETRSKRDGSLQPGGTVPCVTADFIGISFYRREFLSLLQDTDFNIIPVWNRARKAGLKVGVLGTGPVYWNDVGTPGSLAKIHFDVLDRIVNLPAPSSMVLDHVQKKAYPESFGPDILGRLGPYSWIDAPEMPGESTFSKAVVFQDARIPDGVHVENAIVTKFGVISFEP